MSALHVYCVEDGELFLYVAASEEEARKLYETDPELEVEDSKFTVSQEPDKEECALKHIRSKNPVIVARTQKEIAQWKKDDSRWLKGASIKTFDEWARERGKGFLASTV